MSEELWTGILCTKLAVERPDQPALADFPPDGWTVGLLIPVPGQDDGKRLWGCMVIPSIVEDDIACLEWTLVQELKRPEAPR